MATSMLPSFEVGEIVLIALEYLVYWFFFLFLPPIFLRSALLTLEVKHLWHNYLSDIGRRLLVINDQARSRTPLYQQTSFVYGSEFARLLVVVPDHVIVPWTHPKEIDHISAGYRDNFDVVKISYERNALHEVTEILVTVDATHCIAYLVYFDISRVHQPLIIVQIQAGSQFLTLVRFLFRVVPTLPLI